MDKILYLMKLFSETKIILIFGTFYFINISTLESNNNELPRIVCTKYIIRSNFYYVYYETILYG